MVDLTFPILVFFILMDIVALVVLNRVPILVYFVGFFSAFGAVVLAPSAYAVSASLGWLCLFTAVFGMFTLILTGLGYKVVK